MNKEEKKRIKIQNKTHSNTSRKWKDGWMDD